MRKGTDRRNGVGATIKQARLEAGMNVAELAEAVGCTEMAVYKWEQEGSRRPIRIIRDRLKVVLGIDV